MAERNGHNKVKERADFVAENAELMKNCCSVLSKERKHYLRELVVKARARFGYSEKTISQDIIRPLVRAYSKYVAQQKDAVAPRVLLHSSGHGTEGTPGRKRDDDAPTRWDL
jgi:hypothetical protein